MKTIHKYPIKSWSQNLQIPKGAELLDVQIQKDALCVWALVDDSEILLTSWVVDVVGTGHPANYSRQAYLGTVQVGDLVWHVFAWPE